METNIAVFRGKGIRKTLHNNEWWFSISDVVEALTDTVNSADYMKKMRKRDAELAKGWVQFVPPFKFWRRDNELSKGWGQIATPLLIKTEGGPQKLNCSNPEGVFRVIQ